jgi:hypothetical protein
MARSDLIVLAISLENLAQWDLKDRTSETPNAESVSLARDLSKKVRSQCVSNLPLDTPELGEHPTKTGVFEFAVAIERAVVNANPSTFKPGSIS